MRTIFTMLIFVLSLACLGETLVLRGAVSPGTELKILADSKAQKLDIIAGELNLRVAVAQEKSNNRDGYKVMMSSINAGKLVNNLNSAKTTPYQLSYNGGPFISPGHLPVTVKTVPSLSHTVTNNSPVHINLTPYPNASGGIYSDTVTFTIIAL